MVVWSLVVKLLATNAAHLRCDLTASLTLIVNNRTSGKLHLWVHVYHAAWTPYIGEQLDCALDSGNSKDLFAVAVQKDGEAIGHVPQMISCGVGGVGVNCGGSESSRKAGFKQSMETVCH